MTKIHSHILGGAVVLSGIFASELAQAQDAPAVPPPAAPAPVAAEAPPPPPPAPPPMVA
ncbi:MAG: MotA/TolQ/ExbB proton channel family protein, partial [Myxococcales bacterium]